MQAAFKHASLFLLLGVSSLPQVLAADIGFFLDKCTKPTMGTIVYLHSTTGGSLICVKKSHHSEKTLCASHEKGTVGSGDFMYATKPYGKEGYGVVHGAEKKSGTEFHHWDIKSDGTIRLKAHTKHCLTWYNKRPSGSQTNEIQLLNCGTSKYQKWVHNFHSDDSLESKEKKGYCLATDDTNGFTELDAQNVMV